MHNYRKLYFALLAGTILSTPVTAAAATLTPTLDTLKAEAANLSGSYALTKLSANFRPVRRKWRLPALNITSSRRTMTPRCSRFLWARQPGT